MNQDKQLRHALTEHFKQECNREFERAHKAASIASWELYFGPACTRRAEKRYFAALNRLEHFVEEYLSEFYIDLDCDYVSTSEPEGYTNDDGQWEEPFTENTWHLTRKEASKLLFGVCSEYI